MGTRLDDLLDNSAPAAVVGESAHAATRALAREISGSQGRRVPRRGVVIAGGILSLALLGGASAAAASPEVRLALGWVPDRTIALTFTPLGGTAAESCTAYFHVGTAGGTPSAAALVRARTFIANVDTNTIQMDREMLEFQRKSFDGVEPRPTDLALQISAYSLALGTAMANDLQVNGYTEDSYLITTTTETDCGDGIMQ